MSKKWYRRIMIVFSIFMIGLLLLQLIAGLLRPASRSAQPQPTPISAVVPQAGPVTKRDETPSDHSRSGGENTLPAAPDPLTVVDNLLRKVLTPWRAGEPGTG